jgi:hypothetical protein
MTEEITLKDTFSEKLVEAFDEWSESINTQDEQDALFAIIRYAVGLKDQLSLEL